MSPPIRTSGLEVPGSSVPQVQRALTSLRLLNPRFGSTITLRLSLLRRLPLSVAGGGGSLWTSAARLPSGPRAPCPIRDIWGPLLFDFIGLHGADVRRGVLQPRTQTSSPEILPQEFFQKVTAAAVQWRDAP